MRLSAEQKAAYAENGFLAVENIVPAERAEAMRDRIEALCAAWDSEEARRVGIMQEAQVAGATSTAQTAQTVRKFATLVPHEPIFRQQVEDPDTLDLIEDLIGAPLSLYADQAFLKPPFVGSEKMPHQDNAYFRVEPDDACLTCWCALDDATLENGCMHYQPGSHRLGLLAHKHVPGTPHMIPIGFDMEKVVPVPIKAGGIIFHHSLSLHFSPANHTPNWRRAFAYHIVRTDAVIPGKEPEKLLRLR